MDVIIVDGTVFSRTFPVAVLRKTDSGVTIENRSLTMSQIKKLNVQTKVLFGYSDNNKSFGTDFNLQDATQTSFASVVSDQKNLLGGQ